MRFRSSFWGVFGGASNAEALQVERIRMAMLKALDHDCVHGHASVDKSIMFAKDLETLWYLRPDLLQAIASCRDQNSANTIVRDITQMFKGHLALADSSRFGGL
jgi:hypothetical protein